MRTGGRGVAFRQEDLVPVDAEVGDDANFARGGEELAGQIDRDGLGLAGRDAHVFDRRSSSLPAASFT